MVSTFGPLLTLKYALFDVVLDGAPTDPEQASGRQGAEVDVFLVLGHLAPLEGSGTPFRSTLHHSIPPLSVEIKEKYAKNRIFGKTHT